MAKLEPTPAALSGASMPHMGRWVTGASGLAPGDHPQDAEKPAVPSGTHLACSGDGPEDGFAGSAEVDERRDHESITSAARSLAAPRTSPYNLALGDRRARAARDFLVARGVTSTRMTTVSYGEERPQCIERNEEC